MNVLITGSNGFTGKYAIAYFRRKGWNVTGFEPRCKTMEDIIKDYLSDNDGNGNTAL